MTTTLILPGLRSSGPAHWQTWFEQRVTGSLRVTQRDWNDPHLPDWTSRVRREISRANGPVFIVAHSFGALAAVQAASDYAERIGGVLLVAPADPERFGVAEFLPTKHLSFPTIVVASTNDPWMAFGDAERWAGSWGAELVNIGAAGHINAESGFGPWPEGLALLERLRRAAEFRLAAERLAAWKLSQGQPPHRPAFRRPNLVSGRQPKASDPRDVTRAADLLRSAGWTVCGPAATLLGGRIATPL